MPRDAPCAATDSESIFILGGWDCRRGKHAVQRRARSFDAFPRRADDPPFEASRISDATTTMRRTLTKHIPTTYGDSDGDIVDEDDITESDLENADANRRGKRQA